METIYRVYKIQGNNDQYDNYHVELKPFWRDNPNGGRRYAWVPFFDTREEAMEFINLQNLHSGEYTIVEIQTGKRPYGSTEIPESGTYS